MTANSDLDQVRKDVQDLMDRTALRDCISAHSRGHDRRHAELLTEAYHSDGVDEHGGTINIGPSRRR